jgi:hypothetical protein
VATTGMATHIRRSVHMIPSSLPTGEVRGGSLPVHRPRVTAFYAGMAVNGARVPDAVGRRTTELNAVALDIATGEVAVAAADPANPLSSARSPPQWA